ncbi:LysR family transcriptional regulator [Psychromonas sp. psych-6C06]|uniref:LysR family transcriptional regulator n=1 Tax=Psychromonas sp. psych-6C06 TaxID=2058089 RepID=UPI000C3385CD|nr:LysR family transcriptional regulator [Psychromonas sp. psych-6C06]PKF61197.1 LysR family transcriptional regulator [Psychromonas sp. psych-6C06]
MQNLPITLEAITVLDAIEKRGSYAAAAEQLNKVPSALSYIVQKLEEQLQVTIFQKQGRRSVLTPAGKNLLIEGRIILEAVQRLAEKTQTISNGWEPKINIAISSILHCDSIFIILKQFLDQHPSIEMDISEEIMNGAWEALVDDRVDMIIGSSGEVPKQKGIQTQPLCIFDRVFVVSPDHPLTQVAQPIGHDIIAQHRAVVAHDTARQWITQTHSVISKDNYFYVPSVEYKLRAQLQGIGCGFLPRSRVQKYLDSGQLVELTLDPVLCPVPLYLAWKTVNRGKALQTVREMLIAQKANIHC